MWPSIEVYIGLSIHLFDGALNNVDAVVSKGRESVILLDHVLKLNRRSGYSLNFQCVVARTTELTLGVGSTTVKLCGCFSPHGSDHLSQAAVEAFQSIDMFGQCVPSVLFCR